MTRVIQEVTDAQKLARCFAVMQELRPHLSQEQFLQQVARQQAQGYRLVFAEREGIVRAVAGFRIMENLAWGCFLYIDDLVTRAQDHGSGDGSALYDWIVQEALRLGCVQVHLDSGVQRFGAHRFYLHKGMDITAHHFALKF